MAERLAKHEEFIDELCDQFERDAKRNESPEFSSLIAQVSPELVPRLVRELLVILGELRGTEVLKSFAKARRESLPAYARLIDEVVSDICSGSRLEETRVAEQRTGKMPLKEKSADSPTDLDASETLIKGYRLLQIIGEGGMGCVWMADQLVPVKRRVAIKIIKPNVGSTDLIARFEAERQAVAMMDHPNIAKILDAGTTNANEPFFAMELVKGLPLTDYCDANQLRLSDRLELFQQICGGVQHAHQKGILHRDLKPTNVLVTEYNGQPVPKIIDFGLAKAMEPDLRLTDKTMFTEFGQVMGSFKYMSPEQAGLDSLDIDTRSDVYSLGVILYEMLTGSTPLETDSFRDLGLLKVLKLIREQESPRPSCRIETANRNALKAIAERRATDSSGLRQSLRGDLDWIVMKTLEKDRTRRYDTVAQLSSDLQSFLNGDPVSARSPTLGYRLSKFVAKHRGFVVSALIAATLMLGGIAFSSWFAWQANHERKAADLARQTADSNAQQANAILATLLNAFQDINPEQGGSATVSAVDILREAEKGIYEAELNANAEAKASRALTLAYSGVGSYESAVRTGRRALEKHLSLAEIDESLVKDVEHDLGVALTKAGKIEEGLSLLEVVYDYHLSRQPRSRERLQVGNSLAAAYAEAGRIEEATKLYEQSVNLAPALLAVDDVLRFELRNDLAHHRNAVGEVEASLRLLQENHAALKDVLPKDSLLRLQTEKNLAVAYRNSDRLEEAIRLTEETLTIQHNKLGMEHPNTLATQNNLATFYLESGQTEVGIEMLQKTLVAQQLVVPAGNRLLLRSLANVGNVHQQLQNYDKAIQYLSEAHQQSEKFLGQKDKDTLQTRFLLAVAHLNAGNVAQGAELYESVVAAIQEGAKLEGTASKEVMSQRPALIESVLAAVEENIDAGNFESARKLLDTIGVVDQPMQTRIRAQRALLAKAEEDRDAED